MKGQPISVFIKTETELAISIELAAQWFCELIDEEQADFIIAVARRASQTFKDDPGHQWWLVGKHLVTCKCGTDEARSLVEELNNGINAGRHMEIDALPTSLHDHDCKCPACQSHALALRESLKHEPR